MTLEQLCAALATSTLITVFDFDGEKELLKFYSAGYTEVDEGLITRKVEKLEISKKLADASLIVTLSAVLPPSA